MKAPLVVTHAHCGDGFGAAWVAHRALMARHPMPADILFAEYNDLPPEVEGRDVYITDFYYPRDKLEIMHMQANRLVVIDHHLTAATALEGLPYVLFDQKESGASLTWRYFHGNSRVPNLIKYIRDYDLWKFELPDSKEVNAWIATHPLDLATWDKMCRELDLSSNMDRIVYAGSTALSAEQRTVENHVEKAKKVTLKGVELLVCNATTLRSKVGDVLSKQSSSGAGAVWFMNEDGSVHWSLRADKSGRVDVRSLAEQFPGGGGHTSAAGFKLSWVDHFNLLSQGGML